MVIKVGFLVLNPMGEALGYSIRPYELTKHLSQIGVEVHVFSPHEIDAKISDTLFLHSIPSIASNLGLTDIMYRQLRRAAKSSVFLNFFLYREKVLRGICKNLARMVLQLMTKQKIDVLHGDGVIPSAALLSLKENLRIPIVADLPDLLAEEEILTGRIREAGPAFRVLRTFIKELVDRSDILLVANEEAKRRMVDTYDVDQDKVAICLNAGTIRQERRAKSDEIPRVIYAGNFERYEHVDLFIKSLPHLKKRASKVAPIIVGAGPEEKRLRKLAASLGFEDIFVGRKTREETFKLCAICDVGVVPTKKSFATPIKFFDYLSVGLPVVTIRGMWWSEIVEKYQVGATAHFDPECYAEAIATLLSLPDLERYSINAKNLILKKYNWHEVAKDLSKIYDRLIR